MKKVSEIFSLTVKQMANALHKLTVFYSKEKVAETLPKTYQSMPGTRCIIDCSEIFIQRPYDLQFQSATWSDYKHHNTVKFLIGITPQGSICFLSKLWGGRATDRCLVVKSGFLDYIDKGDVIMADRGFQLHEEFLMREASLIVPPGKRGSNQMTRDKVLSTKKVANSRIHVERVIRRLKCFRFLSRSVCISNLPHLDNILIICSAIVNLQGPIVKSWVETASDDE